MSSQEIRHAFFSQKQMETKYDGKLEPYYTNIYFTTDGREVEVTEVCKQAETYNKKTFTDFVYLGEVTKWVRRFKYDSHQVHLKVLTW